MPILCYIQLTKSIIRNVTKKELLNSKGTCYKRAFMYLSGLPKYIQKNTRLVHGKIVGLNGSLKNVRFPHAWVESNNKIYDIGYRKKKPHVYEKKLFYYIFQVSDVKKYTIHEAYEKGLKAGGNYGAWK